MKIRNSIICMALIGAGLYSIPMFAGWGHLFKGLIQFSLKTRPRAAITATAGSWGSYYLMLNKNQRNQMNQFTTDAFAHRLLQLKNVFHKTGTLAHEAGRKIGTLIKQ